MQQCQILTKLALQLIAFHCSGDAGHCSAKGQAIEAKGFKGKQEICEGVESSKLQSVQHRT